jgi:hypothetical protein
MKNNHVMLESVKVSVKIFWLSAFIIFVVWIVGPTHYTYLQTVALGLTLAAVVWYAELTRRIYQQIKRQTRISIRAYKTHTTSVSAEWTLKLEDRFESPEYIRLRAKAAKHLTKGEISPELKRVWDFFETVGLLTKTGILQERMVWNTFFTWLNGYWQASILLLKEEQKVDPLLWEHVNYLYGRSADCERRHYPGTEQLSLSPQRISVFLQDEVALLEG